MFRTIARDNLAQKNKSYYLYEKSSNIWIGLFLQMKADSKSTDELPSVETSAHQTEETIGSEAEMQIALQPSMVLSGAGGSFSSGAIGHVSVSASAHQQKKSFACHICPKSFWKTEDLKRHVRVHTGERPYSCSVCPYRAAQKGTLKQHFMRHLKEGVRECLP